MNQEPLAIPRFVALVSREPVDQDTVKRWFKSVKIAAPIGTILAIPTTDDKGMPRTVCLVHRETSQKHLYLVPLTRDLSESEAAKIVAAFTQVAPDGEFEVETSASHLATQDAAETDVVFDEDKYHTLCMAWAKRQHETWMKSRVDQGWRYGTELSMDHKTNPLLRPFDQLPDQYRKPNLEEPQALLDLLNDQGYAIITKEELASMLTLMRQAATLPKSIAESVEDDEEEVDEAISADRLRMATLSKPERDVANEWDPSNPHRPRQGVIGSSEAPKTHAAPAAVPQRPAFGKRRSA
jgi:hypothetical protein